MWNDKLKEVWDENPLGVMLVGGFVTSSAAMLINALSAARSRRAYARQIDYKVKRRNRYEK
jgi:hypothetical protein